MKIFLEVPDDGLDTALESALQALLRRAREQGILTVEKGFRERNWSLAELQPDDDDFAWLTHWAEQLDAGFLRKNLRPGWDQLEVDGLRFSARESLGCLLLLFAAEATRRDGMEGGSPWSVLRRTRLGQPRFRADADAELFQQGRPSRLFREALEAAAQTFHLRHQFSAHGAADSALSLFLQFGLTHSGCRARLHHWLDGYEVPEAYERLLQGPVASETFQSLYAHLYHYRAGNIPEEQLRDLIASTPWVLPAWVDDLVAWSQRREDYASVARAPLGLVPTILEPARPVWNGAGEPHFVTRLRGLEQLPFTGPTYIVLAGQHRLATLSRQPDGAYASDVVGDLILPVLAPEVPITLLAPDGEVAQTFTLKLWDALADVTLYPEGEDEALCEPRLQTLDPARSYLLILSKDLSISQEGIPAADLGQHSLLLLKAGWSPSITLNLEDQILWQPAQAPALTLPEPNWTAEVTVTRRGASGEIAPGESIQLIINHPSEVTIDWARINGHACALTHSSDNRTLTNRTILFDPASTGSTVSVWLRLTKGEDQCQVERQLEVSVLGAARLGTGTWMPMSDDALTIEECRTSPLHLWLPARRHGKAVGPSDWAVVAGDTWLDSIPASSAPLKAAAGFGAPLSLRVGPYNSHGDEWMLAREVRDLGAVRCVVFDESSANHALRFQLHDWQPVGNGLQVVWWDANGAIVWLKPQKLAENWWQVTPAPTAALLVALGIVQAGQRLGAWWPHEWAEHLIAAPTPAAVAASWLRWLRLPLLSSTALPTLRPYIQRDGGTILATWLTGQRPADTEASAEEEGWPAVVRALFQGWEPDLTALDTLLDAAEEHTRISPLIVAVALDVLRIDPQLMGRLVRCYIRESHLKKHGEKAARAFLQQLTFDIGELPASTSRQQLREYRTALIWDCAAAMRINDAIVRTLLKDGVASFEGATLETAAQCNLGVAVDSSVPFRRALGLAILESIAHSIG